MTTGMASQNSFTNDEVRCRILNVYARFVSDVEPDRLSDWLVQAHVITIDQKQRMCRENLIASDRCRAILDHLFSIKHPRAFLVVRQALKENNHYLLETIDNQEPECGIRVGLQPEEQSVLHAKIQKPENDLMTRSTKPRKNEDDLKQRVRQLESELLSAKNTIRHLEIYIIDQKTASELEQARLLKKQKEFETKLHLETEKVQQLEKDIDDQKRAWEAKQDRLLKKQIELQAKLHLENLQNDYKSNPVLIHMITIKASRFRKEINGLAILDKELFVAHSNSSEVEVYDSIKSCFIRRWNLKKVNDPLDIVSCNRKECLYIIDFTDSWSSNQILRVDRNGKLIKKWDIGNDCGWCLSVTDESNVILPVLRRHKLNEYSPDGLLVRVVLLTSCAGLRYPRHAIKLTNGDFVISHGYTRDDDRLRVWLVDADGKCKKSFDMGCRPTDSIVQRYYPIHLSVDGNGFVLVADRNNNRVLLFDSDLIFRKEISSKEKHGLRGPSRILLDESNGCVIVADNNVMNREGQILFFDYK